jgi:hypothetical protein
MSDDDDESPSQKKEEGSEEKKSTGASTHFAQNHAEWTTLWQYVGQPSRVENWREYLWKNDLTVLGKKAFPDLNRHMIDSGKSHPNGKGRATNTWKSMLFEGLDSYKKAKKIEVCYYMYVYVRALCFIRCLIYTYKQVIFC